MIHAGEASEAGPFEFWGIAPPLKAAHFCAFPRLSLARWPAQQGNYPSMSSTTEQPQSTAPSAAPSGIMALEALRAKDAIEQALAAEGTAAPVNDLRPLPFEGVWGVASSVCMGLASDLVLRDLEASGELAGLSKKEAKKKAAGQSRERAVALSEAVAARIEAEGSFNKVEAVNGYINITFDANSVASRLLSEVLAQGAGYGRG